LVAEVVSMLEDDDFQNADIFILPPEDATKSDEDSGPEDDDGDIDNLSGNQLRAEAEATVTVSGFDKKHSKIFDAGCINSYVLNFGSLIRISPNFYTMYRSDYRLI